ncbi:hypothetical protein [Dulcicalothrix desertica]|uniref:hypothetical protein n=1 Tax=Dulcicalothrix desertica TaxID=32056 RepID=UPI000F8EC910|nr:hypothetical protein [Dulcicalothrix desertica]TWH39405.1 hypothetical protein CAL7102_08636 [Dulcicalothrix desertica PCC 7102]
MIINNKYRILRITKYPFGLVGALVAVLIIVFYWVAGDTAAKVYRTSWIGNTFGGGEKWVQNQVIDMYVAPDGTVFTNSPWDEGGREAGIYKNGDAIARAEDLHGWGRFGGIAVTTDKKYMYVSMLQGHIDGKGNDYPPADTSWYCVRRFSLSGKPAPFTGGNGWDKSMLIVSKKAEVSGLAISGSELFVAVRDENIVRVYNTQTLKEIRSFSVPTPTKIAVDKQNTLWIIQNQKDANSAQILHYSKSGNRLPQAINNIPGANAIAIDNQNRLLIGDNGKNQQILIYDIKNKPVQVSTFGLKGGVYAGTPGKIEGLKFYGITGVGVDAKGNIYVNSSGFNLGKDTQGIKTGTDIRKFSPNGALQWQVVGLPFVDNADADPKMNGTHVYTMHDHYVMDYSKPAGKQWTYFGYTFNPFKYPDDIRLRVAHGSVFFRRIQGKPFMYFTNMFGSFLQAYRFNPATDGEIAIPSVLFQGTPEKEEKLQSDSWPPNQSQIGDWIWQDKNGNGAFDQGEFDASKRDYPYQGGWWVDSKGDVWKTLRMSEGIRHFPLQGIDSKGNPIYTYSSMKKFATPAEIKDIRRIEYFPETDTMYLSGFTERYPAGSDDGKAFGSEVFRYDNWSKGNRKERWRVAVPYDTKANPEVVTASMTVAGDYLFIITSRAAEVYIYNKATGAFVIKFKPGPEVANESGWIDIPYGIRAFQRTNGDYLVFAEEDWKAKVIVYQLPKKIPVQKADSN